MVNPTAYNGFRSDLLDLERHRSINGAATRVTIIRSVRFNKYSI